MPSKRRRRLTRAERLALAAAALRGLLGGGARAVVDWLIGLLLGRS
jgi:hypothetical protein